MEIIRVKGDKRVVAQKILCSKNHLVFKAYEPTTIMGNHSSFTSMKDEEGNDKWYGDISARRIAKGTENSEIERQQNSNQEEAYRLIDELFPELQGIDKEDIHTWHGSYDTYIPIPGLI